MAGGQDEPGRGDGPGGMSAGQGRTGDGTGKEPMYQLTGVTKDYHKGRATVAALRGVDATIGDGEWLSIHLEWPATWSLSTRSIPTRFWGNWHCCTPIALFTPCASAARLRRQLDPGELVQWPPQSRTRGLGGHAHEISFSARDMGRRSHGEFTAGPHRRGPGQMPVFF